MIKNYVKKSSPPTVQAIIYENNKYPEIFEFLSTKYPKMMFSKDRFNMLCFLCYENLNDSVCDSRHIFYLYVSDVLVLEDDKFQVIKYKEFQNTYLENKPI